MARQDENHSQSSLPLWKVEKIKINGKKAIRAECPTCESAAVVLPVWLTTKINRYATRTCTYCFRTAILPSRESELRDVES